MRRFAALCLMCSAVLAHAAQAQETFISLQTDQQALTTGQEAEIRLQVDNVSDLWLLNAEIHYDPAKLYIIGTKSGAPLRTSAFFASDANASIDIFNQAQENTGILRYTVSRLAPASALSGSGIVARFRVVPLSAGETVLQFRSAELIGARFSGEGEARTAQNIPISFNAVRLTLQLSGETVEPPSEATAVPTPTLESAISGISSQPQVQPTLANLETLPTPGQTEPPASSPSSDNSGLIVAALILIAGAGLGLGAMLLMRRRRS